MEALAPGHTAEKCKCRCWSSGQPDPLTSCLTVWGSLILSRTPGKYSPLVRNFSLHNTHTPFKLSSNISSRGLWDTDSS